MVLLTCLLALSNENVCTQVKPWGCRWFQLWRQHVETAVANQQRLQVFYFEGKVGEGGSAWVWLYECGGCRVRV